MAIIPEASKAAYTFLGKSGIKVSNLCLGCMTFGESKVGYPGQLNEEESHKILNRYAEWGGNFIDTANIYGQGESEQILGSWLEKQKRGDFVIATKVAGPMGPGLNDRGLSRRHITENIDKSLARLRTDYVDLYQIHGWDFSTPIDQTLRTLDDLVRAGKIRHYGACNVSGWQMQKIIDVAQNLRLNPCISLQQQYSLLCRDSEVEAFQVAQENGVSVLPWSPLRRGALTGKVKRGQLPTEGRMAYMMANKDKMPGFWTDLDDKTFDLIEAAEAIGKSKSPKRSTAQVSLRWLIQRNVVGSVIIGARTLQQLDDNMGASNGWSLTKEEMDKLDQLSARPLPFPYGMMKQMGEGLANSFLPECFVKSTA